MKVKLDFLSPAKRTKFFSNLPRKENFYFIKIISCASFYHQVFGHLRKLSHLNIEELSFAYNYVTSVLALEIPYCHFGSIDNEALCANDL